MAGQLTEKQQQILDYIKSEILQKGYPPSVREICIAVHLKSTSSVHAHLSSLEEKGYIRRDPTKPRTIEVIDDAFALTRREMTNVPIIGTITAGEPILAQENIEDYFPIPVEYLPNAVVFMLKVRGDSMINAGIYNGDTVIVEQRTTAKNGDMV
ncbi:MAG: transcriptional repressor LexA, partial [Frisingicoccus sp.]